MGAIYLHCVAFWDTYVQSKCDFLYILFLLSLKIEGKKNSNFFHFYLMYKLICTDTKPSTKYQVPVLPYSPCLQAIGHVVLDVGHYWWWWFSFMYCNEPKNKGGFLSIIIIFLRWQCLRERFADVVMLLYVACVDGEKKRGKERRKKEERKKKERRKKEEKKKKKRRKKTIILLYFTTYFCWRRLRRAVWAGSPSPSPQPLRPHEIST